MPTWSQKGIQNKKNGAKRDPKRDEESSKTLPVEQARTHYEKGGPRRWLWGAMFGPKTINILKNTIQKSFGNKSWKNMNNGAKQMPKGIQKS